MMQYIKFLNELKIPRYQINVTWRLVVSLPFWFTMIKIYYDWISPEKDMISQKVDLNIKVVCEIFLAMY